MAGWKKAAYQNFFFFNQFKKTKQNPFPFLFFFFFAFLFASGFKRPSGGKSRLEMWFVSRKMTLFRYDNSPKVGVFPTRLH